MYTMPDGNGSFFQCAYQCQDPGTQWLFSRSVDDLIFRTKSQALRLVPSNLSALPLAELVVFPYMPVPDTNGEEWDRLEPASALDALVELILHGEYNGIVDGEKRTKDGMELRGAALGVFQVRHLYICILLSHTGSTLPSAELRAEGRNLRSHRTSDGLPARSAASSFLNQHTLIRCTGSQVPATPLLYSLTTVPVSPLSIPSVTSTHLATLLFAHLLRHSPRAKTLARSIVPQAGASSQSQNSGAFFVPADGGSPPAAGADDGGGDDDEPQTLLQILSEHLSLAFLARARPDLPDREAREWDRLCVGYLCLLIQWLWEDPAAVREFLEAGALGVVRRRLLFALTAIYGCGGLTFARIQLVEPINQTAEADAMIPGLCAFLLGVCYEFNREPGEVTRYVDRRPLRGERHTGNTERFAGRLSTRF